VAAIPGEGLDRRDLVETPAPYGFSRPANLGADADTDPFEKDVIEKRLRDVHGVSFNSEKVVVGGAPVLNG
jgi:hypothetical protein